MPTFRNIATTLSSPRLLTWKAVRMVYSFIGVQLDALAEAAHQAVHVRFPETCPEDALLFHSRDRGIMRGPNESSATFRQRLLLWLDAWHGAGVGKPMLDQIAGYILPATARIRVWTQQGVVYTREIDGAFTVERVDPMAWNWDNQVDYWARFWVVIYSVGPSAPWAREPVFGTPGHLIGERVPMGGSIGSTATVSEVQGIRSIVAQWKPAGALCPYIIVSFDAAAFAPTDGSPPLPDGTWGNYWDSVTQTAGRDKRGIYWRGGG